MAPTQQPKLRAPALQAAGQDEEEKQWLSTRVAEGHHRTHRFPAWKLEPCRMGSWEMWLLFWVAMSPVKIYVTIEERKNGYLPLVFTSKFAFCILPLSTSPSPGLDTLCSPFLGTHCLINSLRCGHLPPPLLHLLQPRNSCILWSATEATWNGQGHCWAWGPGV